jgi:hypothetical protein
MSSTPGVSGRFKKGDDPRRNKGARCKEAQSFAVRFANALATGGDPAGLAALLWTKALKGQPWAIEIILDRAVGKPKANEGEPLAMKLQIEVVKRDAE